MNSVALFQLVRKDKLDISPKYVCADTNSLFCLCTQHEGRLISHSNISVGNEEMAEMHAEATPFIQAMERETLAPLTGKM